MFLCSAVKLQLFHMISIKYIWVRIKHIKNKRRQGSHSLSAFISCPSAAQFSPGMYRLFQNLHYSGYAWIQRINVLRIIHGVHLLWFYGWFQRGALVVRTPSTTSVAHFPHLQCCAMFLPESSMRSCHLHAAVEAERLGCTLFSPMHSHFRFE